MSPAPSRPAPPSATPSTSTTPRCATAPSGRGSATRSPTSSPSPAMLDELGVGFIEGGWPGAMPKDTEFFARAAAGELELRHAALVAFGATRKAGTSGPSDDPQVRALLDSRAPVVTPGREVRRPARRAGAAHHAGGEPARWSPTPSRCWSDDGRRVFLDCEHFFDGYRFDRDYGVRVLEAAVTAGADVVVLCDTNGGMLPMGIAEIVGEVRGPHRVPARHPLPGRHRLRGGQHRRRGRRPAPPTCSAPPTATASGPATPTCSPSSATW